MRLPLSDLRDDTATNSKVGRSMGSHQSAAAVTDTWLTPPHILEALGGFDLDPCACPLPRPWATAHMMWTREDNALGRPWAGWVWMNPPYGPPAVIGPWMRRMAEHSDGIALIFARTETAVFFETVWNAAHGVLFLEGRLHFCRQDGVAADFNAGAPSCLVAYGVSNAWRLRDSGLKGRFVGLR